MKGWKTKTGAILIALSTVIPPISGLPLELAEAVTNIMTGVGAALTFWGIGHKIEKM